MVLGITGANVAFVLVFHSRPYETASSLVADPRVVDRFGEVRFRLLSSARLDYSEGRHSSVRLYLIGTKGRGWLTVAMTRRDGDFIVESISVDD